MKTKRMTFQDVARLAGVSSATVSRVASRSTPVSPAVQKRVRAAAGELGVSLQRHSIGRLIAFLLSNRSLLHPFHSQVLIAAEAYCAEYDYNLVFFTLHFPISARGSELHLPRILNRVDILDGIIAAGVSSEGLLDALGDTGLPFAVLGDTVQGAWHPKDYDVVWIDDVIGAYEMTRYLYSLGHRQIWYIANTELNWFARRHEGYCRAMQELGLPPLVRSVKSDSEQQVGLLATKSVLRGPDPVQAIFCGSDAICHGVYAALRDAERDIPNDISVVGFNDTPEALVLHPQLASVKVFPEQVGRLLAELVINRILDPGLPKQDRMVPTQLVKRESCRPVLV